MAKPKFERNSKEIRAFLQSDTVRKEMRRRADKIAEAAGEGFEASDFHGFDRAHATVKATTFEARKREADDRALTKALEAGRG